MRQATSSQLQPCSLDGQRGTCRCLRGEEPRELEPHQAMWIAAASRNHRVCMIVLNEWTATWQCHVCAEDISGPNRARLDHDHITSKARGVLCPGCNVGIGYIDRPRWLDRALSYLDNTGYEHRLLVAEAATARPRLAPPIPERRCRYVWANGNPCHHQALMFLTEEQVCSRHATGEQKATADDRQRQFSTLAEGLFWSMQRLWRTGAESPTLWPHIVEIDAAS